MSFKLSEDSLVIQSVAHVVNPSETMLVVEDIDDNHKIHVGLEDCFDCIYSWGMYLGDVARAIAEQYEDHFTNGNVTDALNEIRLGILHELSSWEDEIRAKRRDGHS